MCIRNYGHTSRDHLLIQDSSRASIETSGILSRTTPVAGAEHRAAHDDTGTTAPKVRHSGRLPVPPLTYGFHVLVSVPLVAAHRRIMKSKTTLEHTSFWVSLLWVSIVNPTYKSQHVASYQVIRSSLTVRWEDGALPTQACIYIYIYIYMCIYIYIYMYTCTYIQIFIHIYIYIYISAHGPRASRCEVRSSACLRKVVVLLLS